MNEIIISPDGSRQIIGGLAHRLAHSNQWDTVLNQVGANICVFEGTVLRAAQSTMQGAASYYGPGRVLVYLQQ